MKLTIIGAGGVRTPLIVEAIIRRQERLGLHELALMDIDGERLEIIGALTAARELPDQATFHLTRTTDPRQALAGADFVITTIRVGGIESRVIDEQVPLKLGLLGQETTGPGGFAMALRSIPVMLDYAKLMQAACPAAWWINFANPSGMLTEAVLRYSSWERIVGICDAPSSMQRVAAAFLGAAPEEVFLDYFGLNHLGWVRSIRLAGVDHLPAIIDQIIAAGGLPGLPFETNLIRQLGMLPNEYLYYYYYSRQAVENILTSGPSRAQHIARLNHALFDQLKALLDSPDGAKDADLQAAYHSYLDQRHGSYMVNETGHSHQPGPFDALLAAAFNDEGYAGVALDLIEGLLGVKPGIMTLNLPNRGAISGMQADDVVEIPAVVSKGQIQPLAVGDICDHCLALMLSVKEYERETIAAAVERSYNKALYALAIHPLVRDRLLARQVLDGYLEQHGHYFPRLQ